MKVAVNLFARSQVANLTSVHIDGRGAYLGGAVIDSATVERVSVYGAHIVHLVGQELSVGPVERLHNRFRHTSLAT